MLWQTHLGCFGCQLRIWRNWIYLGRQVLAALAGRHSGVENDVADVAGSALADELASAES